MKVRNLIRAIACAAALAVGCSPKPGPIDLTAVPGPRRSVVEATEWLTDWGRAHGSQVVVGAMVDDDDENQVTLVLIYNPPVTVDQAKAAGRLVRQEFGARFPRYQQPIPVTIRRIVEGRPEAAFELAD